jgi:ATP-dependent Clp protease ATP-binding subunit ClpC
MFERFTEKARRVIFFARYEASQVGSPVINGDHMLLGILREDKALLEGLTSPQTDWSNAADTVRKGLQRSDPLPASLDLPLSDEVKTALSLAVEESEELKQKHIGSVHLILGLIRADRRVADFLGALGLTLARVRSLALALPPVTSVSFEPRNKTSMGIISALRSDFTPCTKRLTLEMEPAFKYHLPRPKAAPESK